MYKVYRVIIIVMALFCSSAFTSDSTKSFIHRGTGKVFSFSANGEYFVGDLLKSENCVIRSRSLAKFPQEYQNLVIDKILGPYHGDLQEFSKRYGELTLSGGESYYIRGGKKYNLEPLEIQGKCEDDLIDDNNLSEMSFKRLVDIFETYYPSFKTRGINWEYLKNLYQPKFSNAKNGEEFFALLKELFSGFNDIHIKAFYYNGDKDEPFDPKFIFDWESGSDFIPEHYAELCNNTKECDEAIAELNLKNALNDLAPETVQYFFNGKISNYGNNEKIYNSSIIWGKLKSAQTDGKKIAYLSLRHNIKNILENEKYLSEEQKDKQLKELFSRIIHDIEDSDALIFDNRSNWGGSDQFAKIIASFFVTSPKEAFSTKWYAESDQSKVKYHAEPAEITFSKPIFLIVDSYVASAGENLVLYLSEQKHILTLGKPTMGCYSTIVSKELPNGVVITLPAEQTFDANGNPIEGEGIMPNVDINTSSMGMAEIIDAVQSRGFYPVQSDQYTPSLTIKMIKEQEASKFAKNFKDARSDTEENDSDPLVLVSHHNLSADVIIENC